MTKQQLLEKLSSSEELVKMAYVPVSEVINWVNELENETPSLDSDLIDKISTQVANQVNHRGVGIVDDYDLEMNYREVELSSIDLC